MLVRLWTHQYFPFIANIVESPNNGHIEGMAFVRGKYVRFRRRTVNSFIPLHEVCQLWRGCPIFGVSILGDSTVL